MIVVPIGKRLLAGTPVRFKVTAEPEHASLAVADPSVASLTYALQEVLLDPVDTVTADGAVIEGGLVSAIVITTVSCAVAPLGSVTVSVTLCDPGAKRALTRA